MSIRRRQYPFHIIEPKWRRQWEAGQTFRAWNPGEAIPADHPFAARHTAGTLPPKCFILDMFPYPSGSGLHVGHPEGYTATDIVSRYKRAQGFNVLHPMGWDAFGLPAEQFAIEKGKHPREFTEKNVATFKRQIQDLGFSYDWTREVNTTDPDYFKWSQWIFLKLYNSWFNPETNKAESIETLVYPDTVSTEDEKREYRDNHRLAFSSFAPVNWCANLGTVLSNEEVIDGKSERGNHPVVRKPMRQWMLRITAYSQRLLDDLKQLDWPASLKKMQSDWIGRSEGAEVDFQVDGSEEKLRVFTTRPDTLFGATYMVLSPEHPLVDSIASDDQKDAVKAYQEQAAKKSDLDRTDLNKDKSGVFTGGYAINPVNGKKIPVWVADYVLISYGTGAIMAVPGHDSRDLEFARKFDLPVIEVVEAPGDEENIGFTGNGVSINSDFLTGLPSSEAKTKIIGWLNEKGLGEKTINYKIRDWLFSRQRYWGEPFPIVWKDGKHEALPESDLPVLPPDLTDYKPTSTGEPPLARAEDWVKRPDGSTRETNTMPQWAGSCWYYLRYMDAQNNDAFCGSEAEKYWMGQTEASGADAKPGVDLYVGGTEHAVLHLLYARFWHKFLFDLGHVSTPEPFHRLVNQGLILGEVEYNLFKDAEGNPVSSNDLNDISEEATDDGAKLAGVHKQTGAKCFGENLTEDDVEQDGHHYVLPADKGIRVDARSFKMSKSRGNVVNPDDVLKHYGADAFRLYEMFMGPLEMVKPWTTQNVSGVYKFLGKVWRLFIDGQSDTDFEQNLTTDESNGEQHLDAVKLDASIQDAETTKEQSKALHTCIKKVTEDLDGMRFNTAISAMMIFVSEAQSWKTKPAAALCQFLQLLQPFAPHLAEELAAKLNAITKCSSSTLAYKEWPKWDESVLTEDTITLPVQINGKVRDRIELPKDASKDDAEAAALATDKIKEQLEGKTVRKIIVVPGRLVNIVAN